MVYFQSLLASLNSHTFILPDTIFESILSFIATPDLLNDLTVNHYWNERIRGTKWIWRSRPIKIKNMVWFIENYQEYIHNQSWRVQHCRTISINIKFIHHLICDPIDLGINTCKSMLQTTIDHLFSHVCRELEYLYIDGGKITIYWITSLTPPP